MRNESCLISCNWGVARETMTSSEKRKLFFFLFFKWQTLEVIHLREAVRLRENKSNLVVDQFYRYVDAL